MIHNETKTSSENILEEFSEFPIPTYEEWRRVTENALKGSSFDTLISNTYEGISLQPIYQSADIENLLHIDSLPGQVPYLRGPKNNPVEKNSWRVSQEIAESTPEQFNELARDELAKGLTMVNIVLDEATIQGIDADKASGGMVCGKGVSLSTLKDFQIAFNGINLSNIPVFIDTGSLSLPVLSHFFAYVREQNIPIETIQGCIGMDPLGKLVENGSIPYQLETCFDTMAEITKWTQKNQTVVQTILVKGQPYHNGGASVVEELAFSLATAVEYIRALLERGVSINEAAAQICFSFSIGSNVFMEIAKFRAARVLWATIIDAFKGNETSRKMTIHARTSSWNKSVYDPYVNMLRTTAEAFSAAIGGVDSLHVSPFDEAIQASTPFSRRNARNTQLILQEECHLANVIDPAGGSWYVETLTDEIAKKAWDIFQQTEEKGGMRIALELGLPQETVAKTAVKRRNNIEHCKDVFVGINRYANATETTVKGTDENRVRLVKTRREEMMRYRVEKRCEDKQIKFLKGKNRLQQAIEEILMNGSTIGNISHAIRSTKETDHITSIKCERGAEPFERLRKATEKYAERIGERPKVFLANIGPIATYKPRSDFARDFFEIGGFDVLRNNGFESSNDAVKTLLDSKADIVVICLKDVNNKKLALPLVKQVKKERPSISIYLAGLPSEEEQTGYREEGIIDFVHVRSNCYQVLTRLMEEKGML